MVKGEPWFALPAAEEWYYRQWNLEYRPPPTESSPAPLALFNPEEGAAVYVPVDLDNTPGRLVLQAAHRNDQERVFWHLDGTYLTVTEGFHEIEVRPAPGPHTLTLVDSQGTQVTRHFSVIDSNS
jgi:penicillin-binding protein 1C